MNPFTPSISNIIKKWQPCKFFAFLFDLKGLESVTELGCTPRRNHGDDNPSLWEINMGEKKEEPIGKALQIDHSLFTTQKIYVPPYLGRTFFSSIFLKE